MTSKRCKYQSVIILIHSIVPQSFEFVQGSFCHSCEFERASIENGFRLSVTRLSSRSFLWGLFGLVPESEGFSCIQTLGLVRVGGRVRNEILWRCWLVLVRTITEWLEGLQNVEMHQPFIRESFLPNDVGTIYFLVPASFRGKTRPHEWGRDEKSGSVFLGAKYYKICNTFL